MTGKEIMEYSLKKPGAFLDFPFGPETAIIKVKAPTGPARIFVQLFQLKGVPKVTFSCTLQAGELYRSMYPHGVTRGYHCPPVQQPYFNTVDLEQDIPDAVLLEMADHAYRAVVGKMAKKYQRELMGDEA